jgi:hypothetical protein
MIRRHRENSEKVQGRGRSSKVRRKAAQTTQRRGQYGDIIISVRVCRPISGVLILLIGADIRMGLRDGHSLEVRRRHEERRQSWWEAMRRQRSLEAEGRRLTAVDGHSVENERSN